MGNQEGRQQTDKTQDHEATNHEGKQTMIKHTTDSGIQTVLDNTNGAQAVSFTIRTVPTMRKTGNRFMELGVYKTGDISGIIGGKYSNSVNNQAAREDQEMDFVAQTPKWFEYLEGSRVIGHNRNKPHEQYYFSMKVQSAGEQVYTDGMGDKIEGADLEELKTFLPKKSAPKTQSHLEEKVIWRTVKLSSIVEARIGGDTYMVWPTVEIATAKQAEQEAKESGEEV